MSERELLASDGERDRAAERVREAAAEGRIRLPDVDGRLSQVYEARTRGDLELATRDLPEPRVVDERPTSRAAVAIFGGYDRGGHWVVPAKFTAWSMFGGGGIDLTEAQLTSRETAITVVALWGGADIVVPDDVEVEVKGFGIFGGFGKSGRNRGRPGAPRIVIRGFAMFGGVGTRKKPRKDRKGLTQD
ncbi:DUF1707 domain-containing protein [Streptomyces radicis]|uniref:DUF1707 domain-containing protein n=1 Tax=Streptomyces radicis TaxID=1750517 RepID=A0A3A9W378_9ACTN|nr:DUF1707 domain-containing protein [Streptomyces radicis]RKN06883.1 DUF1707 domain-containing protein [Streptomyces radicis]RKN19501.1 DUF1707 domain-containing protein [Streptomyces radicis]